MQIIAGLYRGRKIRVPAEGVRPIPVLLRKSLFDIIGPRIAGTTFIDGFAGSGIVGIEALSRGAAKVVFVEPDRGAVRVLTQNLALLGNPAAAEVVANRFEQFLPGAGAAVEYIFLDPPYEDAVWDAVVATTARSSLFGGSTRLIVKAPSTWQPASGAPAILERRKVQGSNELCFFRPM